MQFLPGNKCGHSVQNPRRYGMAKFKNRPQTIEQIKRRAHSLTIKAEGWRNYLPTLRSNRKSSRLQRSESRHALSWLISVLVDRMDLETMAVGYWCKDSGKFIPLTIEDIFESLKTHCTDDEMYSISRVKRHWRLLREAGYVFSERRVYGTGKYETDPVTGDEKEIVREDVSIKYIKPKLLKELGFKFGSKAKPSKFDNQFQRDRQRTTEKNRALRKLAGVVDPVADLLKGAVGKSRAWYLDQQQLKNRTEKEKQQLINDKASYNSRVFDLISAKPDLKPSEIRKILGPPPI